MTRRWHGSPKQIADRILEQVRDGQVRTAGQYVSLISVVDSLPDRLRKWLWQQLKKELGSTAVDYLRTWDSSSKTGVCS